MSEVLNILLTNDDGYRAAGIHVLAEIMCQFGSVTAVAPKFHQSGMSMAVSMGGKAIAYKELPSEDGARWSYLDATPASCVKYGLDEVFWPGKPDVVVCGINHGSNAATAANYSGTLGAAEEAALNGILGVGVSLDTMSPDADFSVVKEFSLKYSGPSLRTCRREEEYSIMSISRIFPHRRSRAYGSAIREWVIGKRSSSLGTLIPLPREASARRIWGILRLRLRRKGRDST